MTDSDAQTPIATPVTISNAEMPPDTLNDVGVLKRREIEARIVAPLLERLAQEFGSERVYDLAREVVVEVAQTQGAALARIVLRSR